MASETCAKAAWRSKVPITGPAARTPAEGPQSPDARQRARRRSLGKQSSTSGASISMPCCAEAYAESRMTRASASGGERGEDAEVGVKLDLLDASDSEWRKSGLMLQAAEAPLDGRPPIEVAEPACCRAGSAHAGGRWTASPSWPLTIALTAEQRSGGRGTSRWARCPQPVRVSPRGSRSTTMRRGPR